MQYYAAFAACVALAAAQSTVPTGPPMGIYKTQSNVPAVTATTIISTATATAVVEKRDVNICVAQPTGISHTTVPDTAEAFLADAYYSAAALAAATPSAYNSVYINKNASNNADSYMGYTLMTSYDVQSCASQCDTISGCNSFNVYFERDPTVDPNDSTCSNPASLTHVKCVWWGSSLTTATAVNDGQWQNQFHVVIAGSNAYTKKPVASSSSSVVASTSTTAAPTTLVSTTRASSSTTSTTSSATSTTTTATASNAPFYIQIGNTVSNLDDKWISVSRSGAVQWVSKQRSATKFVLDAAGDLVVVSTGAALNVASSSGKWQVVSFNGLSSNSLNFAKCSLTDPYVVCTINDNFQYAGVCNSDSQLYFGLPNKMPRGCQWAGLYPTLA